MKLAKVLIIYKKSTLQIQGIEHKEPRFLKLLQEENEVVTRVQLAHNEHYQTLEFIKNELGKRGIAYEAVARAELNHNFAAGFDLVLAVGGDGTFLEASQLIEGVPVLGVNSATSSSFGHFCLANRSNFCQVLDDVIDGELNANRLLRLELNLNGKVLPNKVLNEVLVCHSSPSGTSRYFIAVGDSREEQRSSGIWIATPAGSTGSMRAAGGQVLPIIDRQFEYIVREPGLRPNEQWKLTRGVLPENAELLIVSEMRTGALFVDGTHIVFPFPLGSQLAVKVSKNDLLAYIAPDANDIFGH
jgi:NAD+ kinase